MAEGARNIGASVRDRLLRISRESGQVHQFTLMLYANERLLFRLAESPYADRFILKGAMLLMTWFEAPVRGTRDIDLLGFGSNEPGEVLDLFKRVFEAEVADGVTFDAENARIARIREDVGYGGVRIKTRADIGGAVVPVSIDIGFGDATEPKPEFLDLPGLLDMPTARIRGYARETVIAEKFQIMVELGVTNSRLKDYYDIWILNQSFKFDTKRLGQAIAATFARRGTDIPASLPEGLAAAFGENEDRQIQWAAMLEDLPNNPGALSAVVDDVAGLLMPAVDIARNAKANSSNGD